MGIQLDCCWWEWLLELLWWERHWGVHSPQWGSKWWDHQMERLWGCQWDWRWWDPHWGCQWGSWWESQ